MGLIHCYFFIIGVGTCALVDVICVLTIVSSLSLFVVSGNYFFLED